VLQKKGREEPASANPLKLEGIRVVWRKTVEPRRGGGGEGKGHIFPNAVTTRVKWPVPEEPTYKRGGEPSLPGGELSGLIKE